MTSKNLFNPLDLGAYCLKNRVVMAPLTRNRAAPGNLPTPLMALYYKQRASAGLIITEATQIMPEGQGYPNTPGIYSTQQIESWKQVTQAVHEVGGRIFLQLWHVGRISHSLYQPNHTLPVAPSAIPASGQVYTLEGMKPYETPRALETSEIAHLVKCYQIAAKNALAAGFDGVEIHAANGYLIDQFLQDGTNKRTDIYGGSIENRARFLLEITQAVIDVCGTDKVGVRLSPNGTFNDMSDSNPAELFSYVMQSLNALHVVYVHLRTGTEADIRHGRKPIAIKPLRELFQGTLILNDQFDREKADKALADGLGDMVAFGSLFISNPDLPLRLQRNAPLTPPDSSTFYGGTEKGYTDYPILEST
jgi:N-ethylmaleimide reductase